MKRCSRCGELKSRDQFYKDARRSDGLRSRCISCHADKAREYRATPRAKEMVRLLRERKRDDFREYNRRYRRKHEGISTKSSRQWRSKFPERARAHGILWKEIMKGTVVRQPCEVCGQGKAHAHHDDYSKPLEVRWLCAMHHAEAHMHMVGNPPSAPAIRGGADDPR